MAQKNKRVVTIEFHGYYIQRCVGCSAINFRLPLVKIITINLNILQVGGLDAHLQTLKEVVLFPMLYPEIFDRFKINPPKGCIFYGPPGELPLRGDDVRMGGTRKVIDCSNSRVKNITISYCFNRNYDVINDA